VDVVVAGDAGADVEELANAGRTGQLPDHLAQEHAVGPDRRAGGVEAAERGRRPGAARAAPAGVSV
jgi:hypothetical protein